MEGLILAWTGRLGACVGIFTNVVAWSLPCQESVVFPGSHCPKCGHAICWYDIPGARLAAAEGALPRL